MSRLYDTVEPSVIDEDMLQKAVEEQGPKEEAGKIAKREGIDFGDVKALRLEFKSKFIIPWAKQSYRRGISVYCKFFLLIC